MARRRPQVQLDALDSMVESLEDMPQAIRRAIRSSLNDQARDSKRELAEKISRDGISRAKAGGQINVKRATNKDPIAALVPTSRRIPFRFWDYTTKTVDSTGTRASVWVRKDGELMRVWGFVNPRGKKRTVLTRHRKAGRNRIKPAAGHSIKLHFKAAADARFRQELGDALRGKFIDHYNEQLKK